MYPPPRQSLLISTKEIPIINVGHRLDHDGLLAVGEPGVQLTWVGAKIGDWVVTPRTGKPVEVEALWLNTLRIGSDFSEPMAESFRRRVRGLLDTLLAQ